MATLTRFPLVRIDRRHRAAAAREVDGYLVASSDELVVLHVLDDAYRLDGYTVLRKDTISEVVTLADTDPLRKVIETALRLRRERPRLPKWLDTTSMHAVLVSACTEHDLISVHREVGEEPGQDVGRVRMSTASSYVLEPIDPGARWGSPARSHAIADVTRVDIGDAYGRVLAQVAAAWGRTRPRPSVQPVVDDASGTAAPAGGATGERAPAQLVEVRVTPGATT